MKPEAAFELSDKTPYSARWLSIGEGPIYKTVTDAREEKLLEATTGRPTNVAAWQSIALRRLNLSTFPAES